MKTVTVSTESKVMQFVDGENFTIRAQAIANASGHELNDIKGVLFSRDIYFWPQQGQPNGLFMLTYIGALEIRGTSLATRSFYYTSLSGDEVKVAAARTALWKTGFAPRVFKRPAGQKKDGSPRSRKMVDIQLSTDMLSNAFRDNYDIAVLVAGDADYVPLVEEVQRLGKLVYVVFLEKDAGRELMEASDGFIDCTRDVTSYFPAKPISENAP